MWKRSYVATSIALGARVEDSVRALGDGVSEVAMPLVDRLRSPQRAVRAAALAKAVRDIVVAIDEGTLR